LPGFIIPFASASFFIPRTSCRGSPCSFPRCFVLPKPTPCSPVDAPPRERVTYDLGVHVFGARDLRRFPDPPEARRRSAGPARPLGGT
jgi:hypothetical protein